MLLPKGCWKKLTSSIPDESGGNQRQRHRPVQSAISEKNFDWSLSKIFVYLGWPFCSLFLQEQYFIGSWDIRPYRGHCF